MKDKKHFIPYAGIVLLAVILVILLAVEIIPVGFFNDTDGEKTTLAESVPKAAPPTFAPGMLGCFKGAIVIDGNLISLNSGGGMVPPQYLEKMGQAEYLGETKEPVPEDEFPTEELQSNYIPAGYEVYHLVTDEEDSYIVYSEEDFYCIYAASWDIIGSEH